MQNHVELNLKLKIMDPLHIPSNYLIISKKFIINQTLTL